MAKMRARRISGSRWVTRSGSRPSGIARASRSAMPSRRSAWASNMTPPSELIRPPSKAAVIFLRRTAGKQNGRRLSSVMAGVRASIPAKGWLQQPNPTPDQQLTLLPPPLIRPRHEYDRLDVIFTAHVPFQIPIETRYEHTHILAAQGHGKTQTLQHLIVHDLLSPDPPSMVIIDSQGQMIEKIQRLEAFRPDHGRLAHHLIIIDPKDEVPPALNVFDINQERLARYGPQMREQVLNGVLELYSYLFGSLRADLTQQQSTIFRAFARLMLTVPDANLGTLYELLVDHKPFLPYIEKLSEPSRSFFLNDFILPAFNPTRQQIRRRLFDLLDNYTLKRMLSAPQNRLNMFDALNSGKIIVVNTSKEFFKAEQSAFFGRFFIALALQAIEERAGVPERHWHPVLLYIDEAQEYFDDQIAKIITELRKYNCGLVFCHHDLSQLPQTIRSAAARCAVQMIGGAIDVDARALASDLRTTPQFILDQRRDPRRPPHFTEYACYVRNQTEHAVSIRVPFYTLENQPTMDNLAHQILRQVNRNMVGILPEVPLGSPESEEADEPAAPEDDNKRRPDTVEVRPDQ